MIEKLEIVTDAEIEREARVDAPLILGEEADVGVVLRDDSVTEGLGEARIVVSACEEIGE